MEKEFKTLEELNVIEENLTCELRKLNKIGDKELAIGIAVGLADKFEKAIKPIKQTLTELEQIKEAKPSEALECLETIEADLTGLPKHVTEYDEGFDNYLEDIWYNIGTIKQSLLKAQELEKENAEYKEVLRIIFEKRVDIDILKSASSFDEYNKLIKFKNIFAIALTQEEFELLKRWCEKCQKKS